MLEFSEQSILSIETERLKVCVKDGHIKELEKILTDKKAMHFYPQFLLNDKKTIERVLAMLEGIEMFVFPFINKSTGEAIGFITFHNIEEYCRRIEVGYFLSSDHWGNGYAREILKAVVALLTKQGWHRIEATVYSGNTASEKVLLACGFTREGVLRDKYLINGNFHDDLIYSIIVPNN